MKRKVKKFGRGGDILTGLGAGLLGYAAYKELTKDKDSEKDNRGSGASLRKPKESEEVTKAQSASKKGPIERSDERFKEATEGADVREKSDSGKSPKPESSKVYKAEPGKGFATPVKPVKSAPAKPKVDLAKQKVGAEYAKLNLSPEKKAAAEKVSSKVSSGIEKAALKEYPIKNYVPNEERKSKTSPMFVREVADKNASTEVPKGLDLKSGNKTVYGTSTTDVFKQRAEQEKAEKEEKAKQEARSKEQDKEFRERSLSPLKKGGAVKKYASGGSVSSASKRADGIAVRGKTKGRIY